MLSSKPCGCGLQVSYNQTMMQRQPLPALALRAAEVEATLATNGRAPETHWQRVAVSGAFLLRDAGYRHSLPRVACMHSFLAGAPLSDEVQVKLQRHVA